MTQVSDAMLDKAIDAFWSQEGNTAEGIRAALNATTPFSTYPEDRAKLLALADSILSLDDEDSRKSIELADLVQAILRDEAL